MNQPKRGRTRKVQINANEAQTYAETSTEAQDEKGQAKGRAPCRVLKANAIHDGEGGFLPVGHKFDAVDADGLKAKGLAE